MSLKLYVQAKSKKAINEDLKKGILVLGTDYSMFNNQGSMSLSDAPEGTTIAIYEKLVSGSPYTKAWGTIKTVNGQDLQTVKVV